MFIFGNRTSWGIERVPDFARVFVCSTGRIHRRRRHNRRRDNGTVFILRRGIQDILGRLLRERRRGFSGCGRNERFFRHRSCKVNVSTIDQCCEFTIGLFITLAFCALNGENQANSARMAWQRVMDGSRAAAPDAVAHRPPTWHRHVAKGQSLNECPFAELREKSDAKLNMCRRYS